MSNLSNDSLNKKPRLGRGLGSLLSGAGSETLSAGPAVSTPKKETEQKVESFVAPVVGPTAPPELRIWTVSIDKLIPSQFQPRTYFNKEALEELASSIKQNGILQPIVARRIDNQKLEIIAGERRWRAAQIAGLHEVPVILKTLKNQEALELAIIENIQREDLNPIEEAEAYQRLINEFQMTQQQAADKVGKERATVANALRLLNLAQPVRAMVARAEISAGHAKVLLSIDNLQEQVAFAEKIKGDALTVRQLEKAIQDSKKTLSSPSEKSMDSNVTQRLIKGLAEELQKLLGTKVQIDYLNAKGKISIHYYSDEELTQLVERLKEGCQN
jgi:ParB family chromosome partitioning protein